jgi:carbon storage regulator
MLVLTRKVGESIVIDGQITVTISAIDGNRVKVAFEAPKSRRIVRGEIAQDVSGSGRASASPSWVAPARCESPRPAPVNAK